MYNKEFSQFQILSDIVKTGEELMTGTRGAAFCTSPDNKIWIATGDKEIIAYDLKEKTMHQVLKNVYLSTVYCLYSNSKGEILIGTECPGEYHTGYIRGFKRRYLGGYKHCDFQNKP
jgi:ligand-binding sensor domain-containing protein